MSRGAAGSSERGPCTLTLSPNLNLVDERTGHLEVALHQAEGNVARRRGQQRAWTLYPNTKP